MLPPVPSWDALHVLVVHFPVALLVMTPLLLLLALVLPRIRREFALAAFVLLLVGTVAAFVAVSTGEAAEELADRTPQVDTAIERHQELAETARIYFAALTVLLGAVLLASVLFRQSLSPNLQAGLLAIVLVAGLGGSLLIANVAHLGGRLVHVYGVRAMLEAAPSAVAPAKLDDD